MNRIEVSPSSKACIDKLFSALFCILLVSHFLTGLSCAHEVESGLFEPHEDPFLSFLQPVNPSRVLRQRLVTVQIDLIPAVPGSAVRLNLFEDIMITALCDRVEKGPSGGFAWVGYSGDREVGEVNLVVAERRMAGSVSLPGKTYHIRPLEDSVHIVREVISQSLPVRFLLEEGVPVSLEVQVAELVNLEREIENLHPLTWSTELFKAARGHSDDMARLNYFSHDSLDGRKFFERIIDAGYDYNQCGENIAAGYSGPQSVMNAWMTSPGHRANILNDSYCDIGVGYAYGIGSMYGHYWTQDFGRQRGVIVCAVEFTISATAGPHGTISPSGLVTVPYKETQAFQIIPDSGYRALDVIVDGLSMGALRQYTFESVTRNHTIEATFEAIAWKPMPWLSLLLED